MYPREVISPHGFLHSVTSPSHEIFPRFLPLISSRHSASFIIFHVRPPPPQMDRHIHPHFHFLQIFRSPPIINLYRPTYTLKLQQRAVFLIPLLVSLNVSVGTATGRAGLRVPLHRFKPCHRTSPRPRNTETATGTRGAPGA